MARRVRCARLCSCFVDASVRCARLFIFPVDAGALGSCVGQRSRFQQELVKLTLRLDRAAGRLVVGWDQFWRLEGEALAEEAWKALQRARGVLRLPPDLPARTLPTRLHAASFLLNDENPCRVRPSATWQVADRKCAYQVQVADNYQIELYGAAETLSENYRRFGPDKHICNRRFAKLPIARPTSPAAPFSSGRA